MFISSVTYMAGGSSGPDATETKTINLGIPVDSMRFSGYTPTPWSVTLDFTGWLCTVNIYKWHTTKTSLQPNFMSLIPGPFYFSKMCMLLGQHHRPCWTVYNAPKSPNHYGLCVTHCLRQCQLSPRYWTPSWKELNIHVAQIFSILY